MGLGCVCVREGSSALGQEAGNLQFCPLRGTISDIVCLHSFDSYRKIVFFVCWFIKNVIFVLFDFSFFLAILDNPW